MSVFADHKRTIIIVGSCIAAVIGLVVVYNIVKCVIRVNLAADFKYRQRQLRAEQAETRRRQFEVDTNPDNVEYGLDTRPEARPNSFRGGMADVSYFRSDPLATVAVTNNTHSPPSPAGPSNPRQISPQRPSTSSPGSVYGKPLPSQPSPIATLPSFNLGRTAMTSSSHVNEEAPPQYDPTWVNRPA